MAITSSPRAESSQAADRATRTTFSCRTLTRASKRYESARRHSLGFDGCCSQRYTDAFDRAQSTDSTISSHLFLQTTRRRSPARTGSSDRFTCCCKIALLRVRAAEVRADKKRSLHLAL